MSDIKRPTCVTVIGWVWMVQGGLMGFSAIMALLMSILMNVMAGSDARMAGGMPLFIRLFPLLALAQAGLAAFAIVAGFRFLKLKAWARAALEGLTWFMLAFIVVFGIFWMAMWGSMASRGTPPGFMAMGLVMGGFNLLIFGVPTGIMLKFLRGKTVRDAMRPAG